MKYIKLYEDIETSGDPYESDKPDFTKYHIISDEDIMDICLEMTDIGFSVDIKRFFINEDGSKTKNPITNTSYPIYDITLDKKTESSDPTLWDGSYYYDSTSTSVLFTSVLNKMKRILPVNDARYCVANERYKIRLTLKQISIDKVGFDFPQFSKKMESMLNDIKEDYNAFGIELVDFRKGVDYGVFEIFTDGVYSSGYRREEIWKTTDEFDNKFQYVHIIRDIEDFLDGYENHIRYDREFNEVHPYKKEEMAGFFKKKTKTYKRYKLGYIIKSVAKREI